MSSWRVFVQRLHQIIRSRAGEQADSFIPSSYFDPGRSRSLPYENREQAKGAALALLTAHKQTQEAMDNLLHLYTAHAVESGATYGDLAAVWGTTRQGARHRRLAMDQRNTSATASRRQPRTTVPPQK